MAQQIFDPVAKFYKSNPTATEFQVVDSEHTPSWKRWFSKGSGSATFRICEGEDGVSVDMVVSETYYADPFLGEKRDVTREACLTLDKGASYALFMALKKAHGEAV